MMKEALVDDVIHYLSYNKSIWGELLKIIETIDENNPFSYDLEKEMWKEQCGINAPLLYISSIYLYIYAKKNNVDTFLFATRDCCHFIKIFNKLFPNEHTVYYNCSRNMFDEAINYGNKYFSKYTRDCLKSTPERAIFVDIHGTGRRIFSYFQKEFNVLPYYFLLSTSFRSYKDFPKISRDAKDNNKFINLVFDARGSPIEMLNYDIIGTMNTYNRHGAKRCEPEYSLAYLEPYHVCINYFINKISNIDLNRLTMYNINELLILIRKIYRVIQDNKPSIAKYIKHPSKHPKTVIKEKEKDKVINKDKDKIINKEKDKIINKDKDKIINKEKDKDKDHKHKHKIEKEKHKEKSKVIEKINDDNDDDNDDNDDDNIQIIDIINKEINLKYDDDMDDNIDDNDMDDMDDMDDNINDDINELFQ